jgi:uncharacterized OsmC-like protein
VTNVTQTDPTATVVLDLDAVRPNGVPVRQLIDTIQAIRAEPSIAQFTFRAKNEWIDGGRNQVSVEGYFGAGEEQSRETPHEITLDEPPVLLSMDSGMNPVEALLGALSGCLTTSLVYHAAALGVEIDEVTSTYEGDLDLRGFLGLDETVRTGYQGIRVVFDVQAAGATDEQLDDLVQIARERSPVFDCLSSGLPIEVVRG